VPRSTAAAKPAKLLTLELRLPVLLLLPMPLPAMLLTLLFGPAEPTVAAMVGAARAAACCCSC
jgi:hypothetical protein